jgi:hypothetical protein
MSIIVIHDTYLMERIGFLAIKGASLATAATAYTPMLHPLQLSGSGSGSGSGPGGSGEWGL